MTFVIITTSNIYNPGGAGWVAPLQQDQGQVNQRYQNNISDESAVMVMLSRISVDYQDAKYDDDESDDHSDGG